jgi:Holliday junction resolvase-like predicted endonuclease
VSNLGIWNIQNGQPNRLQRKPLELEKHLEEWIEQDISLVNTDLIVVGRQVHVEAGYIDLLAMDRLGNYWAIIEIKRGNVRRETISQAIDYLACIDELSPQQLREKVENYLAKHQQSVTQLFGQLELDDSVFDTDNRETVAYVVGTGQDTHLERMASYLTKTNLSITVVTFDTFEDSNGNWTLSRQLEELEEKSSPIVIQNMARPKDAVAQSVNNDDEKHQAVRDRAYKNSIGEAFDIIHNAATKHGLYTRYYKGSKCTMYAPPADKRRCAIYVPIAENRDKFYYYPEAIAEFYPIGELNIRRIMGVMTTQWDYTVENAQKFANNLDKLFDAIEKNA